MSRTGIAAAGAALLAGCVATPRLPQPPVAAAPGPRFDPLAFFAGRLDGEGRLAKLFSRPEAVRVASIGRVEGGTLQVDQIVREGGKPARPRTWLIRQVAPGRYRGTLSDAVGPVTGEATGNRLHLAFRIKGGLAVEQRLTLAADGRSADNVLTVTKLGLRVAVLHERIRRLE